MHTSPRLRIAVRVLLLVLAAGVLVLVGSEGSFLHALTSRVAAAPPPSSSASARGRPPAAPPGVMTLPPASASTPPRASAIASPQASASAAAPPRGRTADGKIVLNEATEEDLVPLPGMGRARARAVIELRTKLGRFKKVEELLKVKGIGRKRLHKLRDRVVLDRG